MNMVDNSHNIFLKLITIFQEHFKIIMNQFGDKREVYFRLHDEPGIFPFLKKNLLKGTCFAFWHKNQIEIRFNKKYIQEYINFPNRKVTFLNNLFKQIAEHEYAHTIQYKSMYYQYPKDTRQSIINKNPIEISIEDLRICIETSKSHIYNIENNINNNVQYPIVDGVFQDFWANLIVYEKIRRSIPPYEVIKNKKEMMIHYKSLNLDNILDPNIYYNERVFDLLRFSQEFFIYDKWDDLSTIYRENNLDSLLNLYKYINSFFQKIIKLNSDQELIKNDLFELVKILDKINYHEIIVNNNFHRNEKSLLIKYLNYLRDKKK